MIEFVAANWFWIVVAGGFVWMHTRRGGCGMHAGHSDHATRDTANDTSQDPPTTPTAE